MLPGFAPSCSFRDCTPLPALSKLVRLHGLVLTGWTALFIAQSALVANGRIDIHRPLGALGAFLSWEEQPKLDAIRITIAEWLEIRGFPD